MCCVTHYRPECFLKYTALQLLDVLSLWRHTTNEALAIQIQVFNEAHAGDNALMDMPGGIDINSPEEVFNVVLNKVRARLIIQGYFKMKSDQTSQKNGNEFIDHNPFACGPEEIT